MSVLHLLPIDRTWNGQTQTITPVLLRDWDETILVDCGYPDQIQQIAEAAGQYDIQLDSLTKLIITHHDVDHIGSMAALKRLVPRIEIIAHELDVPYVEGTKRSLRVEQAEASLDVLPEAEKPGAEAFIRFLQSVEPAAVDRAVSHGERLPWCGGIEIVHTPGHMPGHISLYLPAAKTLIAGDAVVMEGGQLAIANPQYTLDMEAAIRSIQLLLEYDIEQIVCYHGGRFQGDAKQALRQLIHACMKAEVNDDETKQIR
ncbi:MBL fold metallo-hydrolase [Brevibacillus choshinensis]|uniref:MBL fold metallo-hydrolase n=1 Tax=Brevibacillus choshinensis TaxID=54911 RepID=A0ABX7FKM3_BRECH|nr:MBL fold metallo-hydrolase [Brevibacillus choshinensis]QRG66185.1 MBL fold metallo-hydrolase [Brevibacillus choshinensis]